MKHFRTFTYNSFWYIFSKRFIHVLAGFLLLSCLITAQAQTLEVVSITPSKTTVLTGEDFTYSIEYRCRGLEGSCAGQSVSVTIPEALQGILLFNDAFTSTSSYTAGSPNGTATWNIGAMATGTTSQLTFSTQFPHNSTAAGTSTVVSVGGINAAKVTANTTPKLEVDKVGASSVGADGVVTYNLSVRNQTPTRDKKGGVRQDNITLTDTWPAGGVYVSHTQNSSTPPVITSNSITFNVGTLNWDESTNFSLSIQYPIGTFPEGSSVTNEAEAKGTPLGSGQITSNKPTVVTQIQAPRCDPRIGFRMDQTTPEVTAGANPFSMYGWGNRLAIEVSNQSNVPASVDVVHDIPLAFTPIKLDFYNNAASGGINFFYKTNLNNSTWIAFSGNPLAAPGFTGFNLDVSSLGLASGEYLTQIRVRDSSKLPAGGSITMNYHYDFSGIDRNGVAVTGEIIPKLRFQSTCDPGGLGTDPSYNPDQELSIKIVPPLTEFSLTKFVNPAAVPPGANVDYVLFWDLGETRSTSAPNKPIISDLLPVGLDYVAGSSTQDNGSPLPAVEEVIPNFNGTGRTLVRWKFTGIYGQNANNGGVAIKFKARVKAGTAVGTINNSYNVSSTDDVLSSKFIENDPNKILTDTQDLDGDGNTTDLLVVSNTASFNVVELAALESYKWVKGSLDVNETRNPATGKTTAGGTANYRLVVRNLGNITIKDIKIVDILPFVGDKAVIGSQARLSEWRPTLTSAVTFVPNNPSIQVFYSTSQNPCRPEVFNSLGCMNDWTTTPPSDLATVQALKFDFGSLTLAGSDSIQLAWQMRAPADAPTNGEIAWNSFAFASTRADNNVVLAPSEPVKVGIAANPDPRASLGDFVWIDTNKDGSQAGETGINGVRVFLLNAAGNKIDSTVTGDKAGQPGFYLFPNLAAGDYFVQFVAPATYQFTGQTPATATGSDADATSGITPKITLSAGDKNLDIDAGLFLVPTCTKPNAGRDTTMSCQVVGGSGSTASQLQLAATPTGGTWAAKAGNAAGATIDNAGLVSVTYETAKGKSFEFIYSKDGCSDTVKVTVPDCTVPCLKPAISDPKPASQSLCQGDAAGVFTFADPDGSNYQWYSFTNSNTTVGTAISGANGVFTPTADQLPPADGKTYFYAMIATAKSGPATCSDTIWAAIKISMKPTITGIPTITKASCKADGSGTNNDAKIEITGIQNGSLYTVDGGAGQTISGGSIVLDNLPNPAASKTYVIRIFNGTTADCFAEFTATIDPKVCLPNCVKPKWTIETTANCSTVNSTYSVNFSVTGKNGTIKASAGTLTNPSGNNYTVSDIPNGVTLKLTDSLSAVCKFDTTVSVPNCNCPEVMLLNPNATACIGDTLPTLKVMIMGNTTGITVRWFKNSTGTGTPLATGLSYKPAGLITANDTFYVQLVGVPGRCAVTPPVAVVVTALNCTVEIDLALKKSIDKKIVKLGDELTYTIKVYNQLNIAATGVEVTDSLANSVQFVVGSFSASRGAATLSGNVIKWNIGNISASPDTVTLTYKVKAIAQGVHFNTAEISKTNEKDVDSTPNNGKSNEDDIDYQCFSVPFTLCAGEKVQANVPSKYTNVQWFKAGSNTPVASGNAVMLSEVGTYTYTATNTTCPASGCCPIIIEPGINCCPVQFCIPFTVQKIRIK